MKDLDLPFGWKDIEDIAIGLYEKFGDEFTESKIYRIRFTDLHSWVMSLPNFIGLPNESSEEILEQIQAAWVYEWRDNQN